MSIAGKSQGNELGWVREELIGADFGDERLDARFLKLAQELGERPSLPINHASSDWAAAKAAYRFFENPKVTTDRILDRHFANTKERMLAQEKVVVVQDTSALDFTRHRKTKGLGPTGKTEDGFEPQGLIFHTTMAFSDTGLPLGLIDHQIWAREENRDNREKLGSYAHHSLPLEKKESFKWIRGLRATKDRAGDLSVVMVADREADIFELFDEALRDGIDLVIRLKHDRMLIDEEWGYQKVSERLAAEKIKGRIKIEVPGSGKRKPREANLEIRYADITVSAHGRGIKSQANKGRTHDLDLSVVELLEKNPPAGEARLYWILLTTLKLKTAGDALEVVRLYRMRWGIELFFKCLKTGCNVEGCRLQEADKIKKYVSLLSIIAWRILWMTKINRIDGERSCELVLTRPEWQALWIRKNRRLIKEGKLEPEPPEKPPTVHEAMRWLAMQGGFLGRKGDGEPGLITIWRGWLTLMPAVEMYAALLPSLKRKTHTS
jgi:hypothetical protein